jgi:thioredoxin 1
MTAKRILIILLIALVWAGATMSGCSKEKAGDTAETESPDQAATQTRATPSYGQPRALSEPASEGEVLPRMVDLGRGQCVPCKMMEPILKEVSLEYAGRAVIEVIDLRDHPDAAKQYGIRVIPTQIFFDTSGAEVWRHEGFLSKEAIVSKLAELGVQPVAD